MLTTSNLSAVRYLKRFGGQGIIISPPHADAEPRYAVFSYSAESQMTGLFWAKMGKVIKRFPVAYANDPLRPEYPSQGFFEYAGIRSPFGTNSFLPVGFGVTTTTKDGFETDVIMVIDHHLVRLIDDQLPVSVEDLNPWLVVPGYRWDSGEAFLAMMGEICHCLRQNDLASLHVPVPDYKASTVVQDMQNLQVATQILQPSFLYGGIMMSVVTISTQ